MHNHGFRMASMYARLLAGALLLAAALGTAHAQVSNTARIDTPAGIDDADPGNNASTVVTPLAGSVATTKSASPASGTTVAVGQTITYTLTTTVSDGPLATPLQLGDALGTGLAFGAVTSAGVIEVLPAGRRVVRSGGTEHLGHTLPALRRHAVAHRGAL